MPPEELPEAKFARLRKQLQDSILREYPNPEREGCPGDGVLKELATRPLDRRVEDDPNWHHVTHCSECYREFLGFATEHRQRAKVRRLWVVSAAAAALVIIGAAIVFIVRHGVGRQEPRMHAELAYRHRTVDIPAVTRSAEGSSESKQPILLEREPLELTVQLPVGSKAGRYQFQLRRGDNPVISAGGDASMRGGTTSFTVRTDLSQLQPGSYSMYVRQPPWDWNYFPVVVR